MSDIKNLAILASAGSGKTFKLAHRYIRLLADDREEILPDRICAMTFTRKAAGEIFDEIAGNLRKAAASEKDAKVMAVDRIHLPHMKKKDFLRLLRRFIDNMHRARIGTLDSFIVGIAKAFPFELGIPLNFRVMDNESILADESRRAALTRILLPGYEDGRVQQTFLEAFKRATYGHEEKTFGEMLNKFVGELKLYYRLCPDREKWGNEALIWSGGERPWSGKINTDLTSEADLVVNWADQHGGDFYKAMKNIATALAEYGPTNVWDDELKGVVFERLLDGIDSLEKGGMDIAYGKKEYAIPDDVGEAMYKLLRNLLIVEYDRAINRTQGLFDLLEKYEVVYDEVIRSTGNFSFADIQYLLARPGGEDGGSLITRDPGLANRLYIDYRMDCRLDHWLIDEFQDTSDLQWAIFEGLVDEIVQAPEGSSRSLFYVGDVKQAIYRWRGGNHRLFRRILEKYGDAITLESMAETRRCAQPVVDAVNKVFAPPFNDLLPDDTIKAWGEIWQEHKTAATGAHGYVAMLEAPEPVTGDAAAGARCVMVAELLKTIDPVARGLKVGVLTRTNDGGRDVANILRRECPGMPVIHEGAAAIAGNELAQGLLSLVAMAGHPGDEFAWQYIQMTPFAGLLAKEGINRRNISQRFLADIEDGGFQRFVHFWGLKLTEQGLLNDYGKESLLRMEDAAGEFDQTGSCDGGSFVRFIGNYSIKEPTSGGAVRVMTIHQSKGLGFDIVILPELQSGRGGDMGKAVYTDLARAGEASETDWILRMPKKVIGSRDPDLKKQFEADDAAAGFDSLCLLYVAMTRARYGLYMISSSGKTVSKTLHPASFLKLRLGGLHGAGEESWNVAGIEKGVKLYESDPAQARWYEHYEIKVSEKKRSEEAGSLPRGYADAHERSPILRHREPSKQSPEIHRADSLFRDESSDVIEFGSAIHELFEKIEWIEDADIDVIVRDWKSVSMYSGQVTEDVIKQFRACMGAGVVREYLAKPERGGVWREKRFEIILKDEFVSGAFDRVTMVKDRNGVVIGATILDYKSSRVDDDAGIDRKVQEYKTQMDVYREALSLILGIRQTAITCCLLFTRQQEIRIV